MEKPAKVRRHFYFFRFVRGRKWYSCLTECNMTESTGKKATKLTKSCNLFFNITAKRTEWLFDAFYHLINQTCLAEKSGPGCIKRPWQLRVYVCALGTYVSCIKSHKWLKLRVLHKTFFHYTAKIARKLTRPM